MAIRKNSVVLALLLLLSPLSLAAKKERPAEEKDVLPTVAQKTQGFEVADGLLRIHTDRRRGHIVLELPPPQKDGEIGRYLYVTGLATGVGSNPVGLDRSQQGRTRLVRLRRIGSRVLLEEQNLGFRALSENLAEQAAVRDSFAFSVLWGGEIVALDADGRSLVDFGSFLTSDFHGIVRTLGLTGQGSFKIDPDRSVPDLDATLVFPDNVELEAIATFTGTEPGPEVSRTVPTPEAISLVLHHSFVRLPDDGYRPRRFDPRAPSFGVSFLDYSAPLDSPLDVKWISRHRLEKLDPTAKKSRVVEPITYYLDPGVPEPVRSALREGASWWAEAFEAAGFVDAFRVEELPADAHAFDVRYNVIQWVHRSTRGWSYGGATVDPRTGEILKGHVLLGSLRVRQDRLLFEGLAGADATGSGLADDPVELALARIRQLAAHEVGHTLGFTHNFAASTYGDRASVMDYPAPLIDIDENGDLDFGRAYGVGLGAWDLHAVRYAYSQFPDGVPEAEALSEIVREGQDEGFLFVSDNDARPRGSAHPLAHLWDNGADPVEALLHTLQVRRIALDRFGRHNLAKGRSLAFLQEVLAPVYFHHRFQVEAAVKIVGGVNYSYGMVEELEAVVHPVEAAWQRRALAAVLEILDPEALDLKDEILDLLAPRPFGYGPHRELFGGHAGPAFDGVEAAATATDQVVSLLFEKPRAVRLIDQHRRDENLPGLEEVIEALLEKIFAQAPEESRRQAELRRVMESSTVDRLLSTAADSETPARVRERFDSASRNLRGRLAALEPAGSRERAHVRHLQEQIDRFLTRGTYREQALPGLAPQALPPGGPIGASPYFCASER